MPRPAVELLSPGCPIKPAWAVFDPAWYLRRYTDARVLCAGQPSAAALLYYLRVGARLGHSPSPFFDELFYLTSNPDIAALVRAGRYESGFEHFCQHGHRGVSPHWLFDDALYANLYEDMTLETLDAHLFYGRYDDYLKSGQHEGRIGQYLFDPVFYRDRALAAGAGAQDLGQAGPYSHFLQRLGAAQEELPPSIYFDPFWYRERHPDAKAEIARGRYAGAIHHYLAHETPEYLDPVPEFSEHFYRAAHKDIASLIEAGLYRSAYEHFVQQGAFELRQPHPSIDLTYYRDMNLRVRNDLDSGAVRDAFAHLRLIGLAEGLPFHKPDQTPVFDETAARTAFIKKAESQLAVFARVKLDFSCARLPELAVIMAVYNHFALTMQALASLRENFAGAIQLIIVDNASTDETRRLSDYVRGAIILRNESNLGFLRACNQALAHVSAPNLLYLNNDITLGFGAVTFALRRLKSADGIGGVGGKILRTHGLLQEAGSIIWNEGTVAGYMRDASPLAPEANFIRDVDFCSAVFLLCRTALVRELGGFDPAFLPAYFEDVDLCVRMIEAGYRVVYDPAVMVHHLEYGSAPSTEASMALMRRGQRIFIRKHKAFLARQLAPETHTVTQARSRGRKPVVLFIEDTIPLRRLGSGFVRSNDIVHAISAAGHDVHVFPVNGASYDAMSLFGDLPEDAEILHDRSLTALPVFLAERKGIYDMIWIARTHNFARVFPLLQSAGMSQPVVLDTEALAAVRDGARARLEGRAFDRGAVLRTEFEGAASCHTILAVNAAEVATLHAIGFTQAAQLGTARAPSPTTNHFAARHGLLFVGAIHQADSPNLDALRWYAEKILPALAAELGIAPALHVVGYTAPGIDLEEFAANSDITLHGTAADLTPFYESARIFIAPTRFAAGTPYKLYEAASFGLPIVATDLLAAQLGWAEGAELLTAPVDDAKAFARQIAHLYRDETLWRQLRAHALARLQAENGIAGFNHQVAGILRAIRR